MSIALISALVFGGLDAAVGAAATVGAGAAVGGLDAGDDVFGFDCIFFGAGGGSGLSTAVIGATSVLSLYLILHLYSLHMPR